MHNTIYLHKWQDLLKLFKNQKKVAIACSGGLDSRLLAHGAQLSGADYRILHIKGFHIPQAEEKVLQDFASSTLPIEFYEFDPLNIKEVRYNSIKRCYFCKKAIFSLLLEKAEDYILCDGSNTDDLKAYRPGLLALQELNIFSPYLELDICKDDIRNIAKEQGLFYHNQPSQACLLTRYNYNIEIQKDEILWLDKAEEALKRVIHAPLRLRALQAHQFELHIEADEKSFSKEQKEIIKKEIYTISQENINLTKKIDMVFQHSLFAHFDKNLAPTV